MDIILSIILPIFGVLLLGYIAACTGLFSQELNRGLTTFVINFAIPLLLFRSIAQSQLPEQVPWVYLLTYFVVALITYLLGFFLSGWLFRRNSGEQAIIGLNSSFSNSTLLGLPLIITAYGAQASLPLLIIISVHSFMLLIPATAIIVKHLGKDDEMSREWLNTVKGVMQTPHMWGLVAGLLVNLLGWQVPAVIDTVAASFGAAATPCALFALGVSLAGYKLRHQLAEPVMLAVIKTMLQPFLVWLLATQVFSIPSGWVMVAVTLAALPSGVMVYLFAQKYQMCIKTTASNILISTVVSVFTLSALLLWFKQTDAVW